MENGERGYTHTRKNNSILFLFAANAYAHAVMLIDVFQGYTFPRFLCAAYVGPRLIPCLSSQIGCRHARIGKSTEVKSISKEKLQL